MKHKKIIAALIALAAAFSMSACNAKQDGAETSGTTSAATESTENTEDTTSAADTTDTSAASEDGEPDDEENYDTGDASLDNIRNEDGIGEKELLVISFGTSYNDSRRLTIGAIEAAIESAVEGYSVRRGFTANIVIDHIQRRDGILIDDIDASLQRAVDNGVKTLVVQPTHLMNGFEYDEIVEKIANYSDAFDKVVIGEPLLMSDDDFKRVENAITDWTKEYDNGETAICFMGHGTEAASNQVYAKMQAMLSEDGFKNYFIGTVEAAPTLEDVMAQVKAGGYKRIVLQPLMVVSGDHANNDMAGDEDSWKTAFEDEGFEVVCLLRGLGENEEIQKIYAEHAEKAVASAEK